MMKALRAVVAPIAIATVALGSIACGGDKAAAADSTARPAGSAAPATAAPAADGKPLLSKSVGALDKKDLEAALPGLGYKHSGTTSNEGKSSSNVMVSGTRAGADGKPITLTLSLYRVTQEAKERELTRLKAEGAVQDEVDTLLAVKVWPKDAEDPAAVLKRLTGG